MGNAGSFLIIGMIGGAVTNAAMDTKNVNQNCENANSAIQALGQMKTFYTNISDSNYNNIENCKILIENLDKEHKQNMILVNNYIKNNNDIKQRTELILSIGLSIILVLFTIKTGIPSRIFNYFINLFK